MMVYFFIILSFFQDTTHHVDSIKVNKTIIYQSTVQATQSKLDKVNEKLDLLLKEIEKKRPGFVIPKK